MALPIYLSDPSGSKYRTKRDNAYISKYMHTTVVRALHQRGITGVKHEAPNMLHEDNPLQGYGGLILFGGYDIGMIPAIDSYEFDLINTAVAYGLPVLGICRGMQLINVAFRGTLHSDIGHLEKLRHNNFGEDKYEHRAVSHRVVVDGASSLKDGNYIVASSHHQAVKTPGLDLNITAYSEDGIVEMIEHETENVVGVQWHPEASHVTQSDTLTPLLQEFLSTVPEYAPTILPAHYFESQFPTYSSHEDPLSRSELYGQTSALFSTGWLEDDSDYESEIV